MTAVCTRFPSAPRADDPDLAVAALWSDEIAADLEEQVRLFETVRPRPGSVECPCGLLLLPRGYRCPCDEIAGGGPRCQ